jgi:hypothetical protein
MAKPNPRLIDVRLLEAGQRRRSTKHRKGMRKVEDRHGRRRRVPRTIRNVALVIVFWFALLGLCLFAYDHYFKFFSYPRDLGGPTTSRG